jgi:MoxR-like ATPase
VTAADPFDRAPFRPDRSATADEALTYVYFDRRIAWAVNIALTTRRPLLITGDPGTGKSSLARDVATRLGWAYLSETITSRTRLEDLVARIDTVQRFNDAQVHRLKPESAYLRPGVLWWAYGPTSATRAARRNRGPLAAVDPRARPEQATLGTVVLLDEIDKAEPDLPNDLLSALDEPFALQVPGAVEPVRAPDNLFVVITSNGERRLPPAFLRRCATLHLECDDPAFLVEVARAHLGDSGDSDLYTAVAHRTIELARAARAGRRRAPSTAEFLDTVRACVTYGQRPDSPLWNLIEETALRKAPRREE